jgi:phage tail-like protein
VSNYYPPVGFHFGVSFDSSVTDNENDGRFQSVAGLNVEFETETVKEGGENRFEHVLPVRAKYSKLVLKRGMFTDSNVIRWCLDAFENMTIQPADMVISLLNEEHEPLMSWSVKNAWPTKWNITDFNAEENKLIIETIELTYQFFTIQ